MRLGAITLRAVPALVLAVPPWKRDSFPKLWAGHLRPEWCKNAACPPDGEVLIAESIGIGICSEATYRQARIEQLNMVMTAPIFGGYR